MQSHPARNVGYRGRPQFSFRRWTWRDRAAALPEPERTAYLQFIARQKAELLPFDYDRLYEAKWAAAEEAIFGPVMDLLFNLQRDPNPHAGHEYLIGWDIGDEADYTVGAPLCLTCWTISDFRRLPRGRGPLIKSDIREYSAHWNNGTAVIETNGPRGPILQETQRLYPKVQGWWTDAANKLDGVTSICLRARSQRMSIVKDAAAMAEFQKYERTYNPKTQTRHFAAPSGFHDDYVAAVLVAVGSATSGGVAYIEMMKRQLEKQKEREKAHAEGRKA